FDVVLMDVQMPEMDGLRATRLIRAREKATGGQVPIVAVTANALSGEKERCLAAGMNAYLSKPVRGPELLGVIDHLLGGEALWPGGEPPEEVDQPDWLASLEGAGFGPEEMRKLAQSFLDTVPGRLALLEQAVARGDADAVRSTAHLLKGSLAVFAARQALESAGELEALGKAGGLGRASGPLTPPRTQGHSLPESLGNFLQGQPSDRIEK